MDAVMRVRGFTLIELLIALTIFGFLIMLAGPQLATFLASSQVRNAAEAILNGVQRTQTTAINANTQARFVLDPTTGTGGWQILETIDGAEPAPGPLSVNPVQVFALADGAPSAAVTPKPAGATQITFDGFGRIIANVDTSATLRCVDVVHSTNTSARALRVMFSNTVENIGTKICDPNVAATEPQGCPAACS